MNQEEIFCKKNKIKEFYDNFCNKLEEVHDFPTNYVFKFIIRNKLEFLTEIYRIFDDKCNSFSTKESSNGKYISCTVSSFVLDANQIICLYKEISKIDEVIML